MAGTANTTNTCCVYGLANSQTRCIEALPSAHDLANTPSIAVDDASESMVAQNRRHRFVLGTNNMTQLHSAGDAKPVDLGTMTTTASNDGDAGFNSRHSRQRTVAPSSPGNAVHIVEVDDDTLEIVPGGTRVFPFPHPIDYVHATAHDTVIIGYTDVTLLPSVAKRAAMFRLGGQSGADALERLVTFEGDAVQIARYQSTKSGTDAAGRVAIVERDECRVFSILMKKNDRQETSLIASLTPFVEDETLWACQWDPHQQQHPQGLLALSCGRSIGGFDLREKLPSRPSWLIPNANSLYVRDFDFNPGRAHFLTACGDDGHIRFFDIRSPSQCLHKSPLAHQHWAWSVRYNPYHEQLVASGGGDAVVLVHRLANANANYSSSSSSSTAEDQQLNIRSPQSPNGRRLSSLQVPSAMQQQQQRRSSSPSTSPSRRSASPVKHHPLLLRIEQHQESVYQCAWSRQSPWLLASVSHDGRVLFSSVPQEQRFQVLLS